MQPNQQTSVIPDTTSDPRLLGLHALIKPSREVKDVLCHAEYLKAITFSHWSSASLPGLGVLGLDSGRGDGPSLQRSMGVLVCTCALCTYMYSCIWTV